MTTREVLLMVGILLALEAGLALGLAPYFRNSPKADD